MAMPFPGMDPYLEHPVLWTGVHTNLLVVIRQQLAPLLPSRYVASVEGRVLIDVPERLRVPDVWIEKVSDLHTPPGTATASADAVVMEIPEDDVKEHYIEILDRYRDLKVVTVIEVVSPTNKAERPGREQFLKKRRAPR